MILITLLLVLLITLAPSAHALTVGLGAKGGDRDMVRNLGPHSLRIGSGADSDAQVAWAVDNGIGVVLFLGYGGGCDVLKPEGRQCYAAAAAKAVQKHGAKVQYYEVWNEWNGGLGLGRLGWNKPPANDAGMYTDLLCKTYNAIKAVRPNAVVAGGAVAGADLPFITGMLNSGAGNCMDVLSVHLYVYRQTWPGHVPAGAPGAVGAAKFIQVISDRRNFVKEKTGKNIPIIATEVGYHYSDTMSHQANEMLAAEYVTELYKKASSIPFLEGIWWYNMKDLPGHTFGLVRNDNSTKPAFAAFRSVAERDVKLYAPLNVNVVSIPF